MRKQLALILCCALLGACGTEEQVSPLTVSPYTPLPDGAQYVEPSGPATPTSTTAPTGSLKPDNLTAKERVPEIVDRGRLIVGVSSSLNLVGFQDPASGELTGFDVEIAREIARDIFGTPEVDFRFISSAQREEALNNRQVDIVVRTMTVTAARQAKVAFSAPYLHTRTRILALKTSSINSAADLKDKTVCATKNSTFQTNGKELAPDSTFLLTDDWSDCLVALQQNQVQAIISDDAILSGIAEQDPYTHIVDSLGSSDYAVGIAKSTPGRNTDGLVRQVNATLERIRSDGTWDRIYGEWLENYLGNSGRPAAPVYREEP